MKRSTNIFGIGTIARARRPAIVGSGKTRLVAVFLSMFLVSCILLVMNTLSVVAQPERDAVFTSIDATNGIGAKDLINGGNAKIYYNQNPVYVNITFCNYNCSMASGSMFRINVATASFPIFWSWESADIAVAEGNSSEIVYDLCRLFCGSCHESQTTDSIWSLGGNWSQPLVFTFRLYYYNYTGEAERVLEEEKSITLTVVNEFVAFSQEQCKVGKGETGSLGISVSNLDDEKILDLNLTVDDSGVFEVLPEMRKLGDFAGSEKKITTFDVKAPEATEIGTYSITVRVSYRDILGNSHVESKTVSIAVEPESPPYLIIFSIAAVAIAATGGFLFFRKRKTANREKQAVEKRGTAARTVMEQRGRFAPLYKR